jgi:transposase
MKSEAKVIHHLGLINGICEKIKLVETIDRLVPVSEQSKLSVGMRVKAMVINALGFTGRPMHLTAEFYRTKPVALLFGKNVSPDDINDDSLGRALDKLSEKGPESIFVNVSAKAVSIYGVKTNQCHLDTTSISVEGEYEDEQNTLIRFGHSKDLRSDLKQFIQSSFVTNDGGIPLIMKSLPGNTSDKTHFTEFARELVKGEIVSQDEFVAVFDSAGYTKGTIVAMGSTHWMSRVPETIDLAKQMIHKSKGMVLCVLDDNYSYYENDSEYAGVKQRWFLFRSKHALERETKTIKRSVSREKKELTCLIDRFGKQLFACKDDALKAFLDLAKKIKYHKPSLSDLLEEKHFLKRGKPKDGDAFELKYKAQVNITEDIDKINELMDAAGKFILATNQLSKETADAEKVLKTYKDQQCVERGFRFLKNPISLIKSVYLKNHDRIIALSMIMFITLLVYAIAERALRKALVEHKETVKSQSKKDVQNPTMRWIFQKMEDIIVLEYIEDNQLIIQFMNMTEEIKKIIRLLGSECMSMYGVST